MNSFVQNTNVPLVMNTLGAAQTALSGTVVAATLDTFGPDSAAPPKGHSMLIEAPNHTVGASLVMSDRAAADARDPLFGTSVAGLPSDSLTIQGGSTVPAMVTGMGQGSVHQGHGGN
jgi:hypothetical protein